MPTRPGATAVAALTASVVAAGCLPAAPRVTRPPTSAPTAAADSTASPAPTADAASPSPSVRPSFVRPTPTPQPTFLAYVVRSGDTLGSIARAHATSARSIAFWNRETYPSLDPDAPEYEPDRIEAGWVLRLIPGLEIDPDDFL